MNAKLVSLILNLYSRHAIKFKFFLLLFWVEAAGMLRVLRSNDI